MILDNRGEKIAQLRDKLRSGQRSLADWCGGELAVSAVPGAGKSHSLAVAAALTIAREKLHHQKQLLVVTLTRSATANIKQKIIDNLSILKLPPLGFNVSTIHSLALNIAQRNPELSKINLEDSTLIIPNNRHRLIRQTVENWIKNNPDTYHILLEGNSSPTEDAEKLRRRSALLTEILPNLAFNIIREAKSSGLNPPDLWKLGIKYPDHYNILQISAGLYQEYQNLLLAQKLIDYDEMILGALRVLEHPPARSIWQQQIYAVFEDEAQDSTPLQSRLINILASDDLQPELPPNLIRVGDSNQAINSTFTTADPYYFREFCKRCQSQGKLAQMNQSGRSTQSIIDLANFVLNWGNDFWQKDNQKLTKKPEVFWLQNIRPVNIGDPQGNPQPIDRGVEVRYPTDIYESVKLIADRLAPLLTQSPDSNVAILVRENRQAKYIYNELIKYQEKYPHFNIYEVSENANSSKIAQEILTICQFINRPHSPNNLKAALQIILDRKLIPAQNLDKLAIEPENFLYPRLIDLPQTDGIIIARKFLNSLLQAKFTIPYYQLIFYIAQQLQYDRSGDKSELANVQKLADRLRESTSLSNLIEILGELVNNEQIEAIDIEEQGYTKPGQITIITMHKAKGLDWDYVFIPFLHKDFIPGDFWTPQNSNFLGDLPLADLAKTKIRAHLHHQIIPEINTINDESKALKQAEELRLFYVAITRAKKLLWLAAENNAPFRWNQYNPPSPIKLQHKEKSPIINEIDRLINDRK